VHLYQYRELRDINAASQTIADKLRELSNAQKLIWFNIYDKQQRKVGELYYKQLFKHQDIAPLLSRRAAAQPPKARPPKARKTKNENTPEMIRTQEEKINNYYPGLRVLNRKAQANGSTYERNTFRKYLLGYTLLPRGNAYLTRRARELSNATSKIWFNVHCSNYGTLPRLGLLVQNSILVTAKRCEEETREYRESLRAKRAAKDSEGKTDQTKSKEATKKLPVGISKKDHLAKDDSVAKGAIGLVPKAKKDATKGFAEKVNQTKAKEGRKKLLKEILKKDRLSKGNSVTKETIGLVLEAKRNVTKGSEEKVNQIKAKEVVKKLSTEISKKGYLAKDNPVAKEIIDLVSDDEDKLPLPSLEPTAYFDGLSDEESSVDSAEFDSDWDPEKDDVEGVLVGETYEHENGPRMTRRSHGVTGSSHMLGSVWVNDDEEEGEGDEEDEELRRLEGRVKHEPDGDEGESIVRQALGFSEDIALVRTTQEVYAQIKAEMEGNGDAGWQDDFEWEMA